MPGLPASLLRLPFRLGAILALQHFLILLHQILGHVEHRAAPGCAGVDVAAVPLVFRLVPRAAVLTVRPLVEHARSASPLKQAVASRLEILEDAVPASLPVSQDRHVVALPADGAEDPRQRRLLLLNHRRDGVGRGVLGGRVTVLRLIADVHLGCFHASRAVTGTSSRDGVTAFTAARRRASPKGPPLGGGAWSWHFAPSGVAESQLAFRLSGSADYPPK